MYSLLLEPRAAGQRAADGGRCLRAVERLGTVAYRQAAAILSAQGKRLIRSLKNGYEGAAPVNAKVAPTSMGTGGTPQEYRY